jgi:hypothetical protein
LPALVNVHLWQVLAPVVNSSIPVPLAVAQLSGWTALPLLTLLMVYGVPVAGQPAYHEQGSAYYQN